MELGEVGWGASHRKAEPGINGMELVDNNVVTEQPRKKEDEEENEQESSLESQPDLRPKKFNLEEEQSINDDERSPPVAFGFEKSFLTLRKISTDAGTGSSGKENKKEAPDEEDGQDDDNSLDSGFQENRLQDLEAQVKRASQLSRVSFNVDHMDASSPKKSSKSSRISSEAEMGGQESEKKSSQSSRLSHVLWSKGSSDTDDEGQKETTRSTEPMKDAEKVRRSSVQCEEIEKEDTKEGRYDESNNIMEKAEESMSKVGAQCYFFQSSLVDIYI